MEYYDEKTGQRIGLILGTFCHDNEECKSAITRRNEMVGGWLPVALARPDIRPDDENCCGGCWKYFKVVTKTPSAYEHFL